MKEVELVIKIPEEIYKRVLPYKDLPVISNLANDYPELTHAVANGVPLPKGHGRLLILSEDVIKREQTFLGFSCQSWIGDVGLSNATVAIIEADTESEENNG